MGYKVAVAGASGFAGIELVRLLLGHPGFDLVAVTSDSLEGVAVSDACPGFRGVCDLTFLPHDTPELHQCDVVFLAVPHTAALKVAPDLIARGVSVIDLSADFRLKNSAVYERWYGTPHTAPNLLAKAAFGLPELTRAELDKAASRRAGGEAVIVACAGCYPTATALAAAPALALDIVDTHAPIVVDAISGVTGAGRKATERTHFCNANENLEAYGVGSHRHTPEIEQILGVSRVIFSPHLAPLNRGLLSTVTMTLCEKIPLPTSSGLIASYEDFYKDKTCVTVLPVGKQPRTASVVGTNRVHLGAVVEPRTRTIVATGAIDNLCKGAAGQALQCANIIFSLPETMGLPLVALPI